MVVADYIVEGIGTDHWSIVRVDTSRGDGGILRLRSLLGGLIHTGVDVTSLSALLSMTPLQLLLGQLRDEEIVHFDNIGCTCRNVFTLR